VSSREFGKAMVTMTGLPELSDTLIYELWLMGPGSVKPAGLIDASSGPQLLNLGDAAEIGLTVEPDGGSNSPPPSRSSTPPFKPERLRDRARAASSRDGLG
jgi:hypothetical protein